MASVVTNESDANRSSLLGDNYLQLTNLYLSFVFYETRCIFTISVQHDSLFQRTNIHCRCDFAN